MNLLEPTTLLGPSLDERASVAHEDRQVKPGPALVVSLAADGDEFLAQAFKVAALLVFGVEQVLATSTESCKRDVSNNGETTTFTEDLILEGQAWVELRLGGGDRGGGGESRITAGGSGASGERDDSIGGRHCGLCRVEKGREGEKAFV